MTIHLISDTINIWFGTEIVFIDPGFFSFSPRKSF